MDLMGSEAVQSEEAMRRMWGDSMKAVKCQNARITYDDFLLLMKGQTRENPVSRSSSPIHLPIHAVNVEPMAPSLIPMTNLHVVPEDAHPPEVTDGDSPTPKDPVLLPSMPMAPVVTTFKENTDSPLSMDEDDDMCLPGVPGSQASLTPPSSPIRGATDYITPRSGKKTVEFVGNRVQDDDLKLPDMDLAVEDSTSPVSPNYLERSDIARKRSVSLDETSGHRDDSENKSEGQEAGNEDLHVVADIVRDMLLPETDHNHASAEFGFDDKSKSALVVNRKLYRAHRQMRLAVLEASKRFEEQQAEHAREVLMARQAKETGAISAGLVMRHGYNRQISSEAIRQLLSENLAQQQQLVAVASKKGGRGKRTRKKTISDMSGMLTSIGQDEMSVIATQAADPPPDLVATPSSPVVPDKIETPAKKLESEGPSRAATIPGDFRKTNDPFSRQGRYGALASPLPGHQ